MENNFEKVYPEDITKHAEPVSREAHFGESYFITITGDNATGYKAALNENRMYLGKLRGGSTVRIEHTAMYVTDLEKAKDFFVKYFHAAAGEKYHNKQTGFRSYFLSFDDGARLEIVTKPQMQAEPKALEHTGYIHIAFCLGSKQAVDELTQRLHEDGYAVVSGPRMTGDGYYESCIAGIEGNLIEITE